MTSAKPIDIFMTCFHRQYYTEQSIAYLKERTEYPYRLFVINNGGNEEVVKQGVDEGIIFLALNLSANAGIHAAWNLALSMAESDYFITTDNDIYVPDLHPDWLTQLVKLLDDRPNYGAISLCPHVFIGAEGIDANDREEVKDRNMCGAVMRIMRTEAVRQSGGWEHVIRSSRNHEERTICSRLQSHGFKTGICSKIRAYHPFGKATGGNWGYPESISPEEQGHNPQLKEYVQSFDNIEAYDPKTWIRK